MAIVDLPKYQKQKSPLVEGKSLFKVRRGWDSNPRTPYDVTSLAGNFERGNLVFL